MMRLPDFRFTTALAVFCVASAAAAGPKPSKAHPAKDTAPAAEEAAHLRVWKAESGAGAGVRIELVDIAGGKKKPREVADIGPGYQFADYVDVPAGRFVVQASRPTAGPAPIASVPAELPPGSFGTFLLTFDEEGKPVADFIIDKRTAADDLSKRSTFTVRGLTDSVTDVKVSMGDCVSSQFAGDRAFLRMRGFKRAVYSIHTTGVETNGKPFDWTTEADFTRFPRQTLLIFPDAYGRIRPRMSVDGQNPEVAEEPTAPGGQS